MLYAGVGMAPSRNAVEASRAFASPYGSVRAASQLITERSDNARLEGLGCEGSRACAPCEAKAAAERNQMARLGGWGFAGAALADQDKVNARYSLLNIANLSLAAVGALKAGDRVTAQMMIDAINAQPEYGWDELAASKAEAVSALNNALAELDRVIPTWVDLAAQEANVALTTTTWNAIAQMPAILYAWKSTPPSELDMFIGGAQAVAARMQGRAYAPDMTAPGASLSPEQSASASEGERAWVDGVAAQEARDKLDACDPLRMATGEISPVDFALQCGPSMPSFSFGIFGTILLAGAVLFGGGILLGGRR